MMRSSITALILSITAVGAQSPHSGTPQAEITDYAWLDIQIGSRRSAPLRVVVGLYGKAAPLAVTNFIGLITCEKGGEEYFLRRFGAESQAGGFAKDRPLGPSAYPANQADQVDPTPNLKLAASRGPRALRDGQNCL